MRTVALSIVVFVTVMFAAPHRAGAQGRTRAARELLTEAAEVLGKAPVRAEAWRNAAPLARVASEVGDEVVGAAARKVGPEQLARLTEQAGAHRAVAVQLAARHGDDAARLVSVPKHLDLVARYGDEAGESLLKHGDIAAPVVESFGKPAAAALRGVDGQNARRLAMMHADGELIRIGRTSEVLEVVARYGDRAARFVWEHKGALLVTAALTAFLLDPEPFLDGTVDIARIGLENVAKPLAQAPGQFAKEVARNTSWTLPVTIVTLALCAVLGFALRRRWRRADARTTGEKV